MCHALLSDPTFHALLLRIDQELAASTRAQRCACAGALHSADYPRKPRGCPPACREIHALRLSFCCAACRQRSTPQSVRFLGRRVYLALAVVLVSARPAGPTDAAQRVQDAVGVARRTLARWRLWWREQFPATALWRAGCAQFMPPVPEAELPGALISRFAGAPHEALTRLLVWLSPVTVGAGGSTAIRLHEGA